MFKCSTFCSRDKIKRLNIYLNKVASLFYFDTFKTKIKSNLFNIESICLFAGVCGTFIISGDGRTN